MSKIRPGFMFVLVLIVLLFAIVATISSSISTKQTMKNLDQTIVEKLDSDQMITCHEWFLACRNPELECNKALFKKLIRDGILDPETIPEDSRYKQ